jgi:hypothetical protein
MPIARKKHSQDAESKRRKPQQSRALDTIEVIIEATAQILQREGRAALNTNHIAERAILMEIARREIERDRNAVAQAIMKSLAYGESDIVRISVRALIVSQKKQTRVRRAALDALAAEGLGHFLEESSSAFQQIISLITSRQEQLFKGRARRPSEARMFVISRAVTGAIRAAVVEDTPLLDSPEFEDELVQLVRAFFAAPSQA